MSYGGGCFLAFFAGHFLPDVVVVTVSPSTTRCSTCTEISCESVKGMVSGSDPLMEFAEQVDASCVLISIHVCNAINVFRKATPDN